MRYRETVNRADTSLEVAIATTCSSLVVGLGGVWLMTSQIGKRLDDLGKRMDEPSARMNRLEDRFNSFSDMVDIKLGALDTEIGKLMDKRQ